MSLADAAYALEELAAGRAPDRARLLAGALALDTLALRGATDHDLLDAAAGLKIQATDSALDLDEAGRRRATQLAERVRMVAASQSTE
jgi:hypothetical protein